MPTRAVGVDTMGVGKKGSGKHWTKAQVEARQAAAEGMQREAPTKLRVPGWLNPAARKVWANVIRQARKLDLYDILDTDMLGLYCDAVVQYREIVAQEQKTVDDIKALQAWARIIAGQADKLGLTPQSRARLIKKKADELLDDFAEFDE